MSIVIEIEPMALGLLNHLRRHPGRQECRRLAMAKLADRKGREPRGTQAAPMGAPE
jgi:hypothetical protein